VVDEIFVNTEQRNIVILCAVVLGVWLLALILLFVIGKIMTKCRVRLKHNPLGAEKRQHWAVAYAGSKFSLGVVRHLFTSITIEID